MKGQYDMFGGHPPSQRHSSTSRAAASSIEPRIGPLHETMIRFLRGRFGATDEQMQEQIPMAANTQRPRRRELELWGIIVDSGKVTMTKSRRSAVIWQLA